jgi:hypothetical protein
MAVFTIQHDIYEQTEWMQIPVNDQRNHSLQCTLIYKSNMCREYRKASLKATSSKSTSPGKNGKNK